MFTFEDVLVLPHTTCGIGFWDFVRSVPLYGHQGIRQSATGRARRGQAKERTLHLIIEKGIKLIQRVAPRIACLCRSVL